MSNKTKVIAQNFNIYDDDGLHAEARTGSLSLKQLLKAGVQGVILGHTEAGDSPEVVNLKIKTVSTLKEANLLTDDFTLLIVVGETWDEFNGKSHEEVGKIIYDKCNIIFDGVPENVLNNLIIAYDPKWGSFGSGQKDAPPPEPALISVCLFQTKRFIEENYKNIKPSYVYGGGSTPERTLEILKDKNVDGLLLGSACNTVEKTKNIINAAREAKGDKKKVLVCNYKAFIINDHYKDYIDLFNSLPNDYLMYIAPSFLDLKEIRQLV